MLGAKARYYFLLLEPSSPPLIPPPLTLPPPYSITLHPHLPKWLKPQLQSRPFLFVLILIPRPHRQSRPFPSTRITIHDEV